MLPAVLVVSVPPRQFNVPEDIWPQRLHLSIFSSMMEIGRRGLKGSPAGPFLIGVSYFLTGVWNIGSFVRDCSQAGGFFR